jgi:hypothetical protein
VGGRRAHGVGQEAWSAWLRHKTSRRIRHADTVVDHLRGLATRIQAPPAGDQGQVIDVAATSLEDALP